ncbi:hypothetical protein BC833DRAFT_162530 [Globomyces pollinis-pini]|nr:hypothetical protein BC833DRAFT_162530 [Globomyces pollinis-pini]
MRSRDLADITRDNGLVTMLLIAYARQEGSSFLNQSITQPLKSILPLLADCEIDPQKIHLQPPNNTTQDINTKLLSNRHNLQLACQQLFITIFDFSKKPPPKLLSMCHFLSKSVDEVLKMEIKVIPLPAFQIDRSTSVSSHMGKDELGRKGSRLGNKKRTISQNLQLPMNLLGATPAVSTALATSNTSVAQPSVAEGRLSKSITVSTNLGISNPPLSNSAAVMTTENSINSQAFDQSVGVLNRNGTNQSKANTPTASTDLSPENKTMSPTLEVAEPTNSVANLGNLSISDKVVGSFMFLRFIIPAITSPESNAAFTEKLSPHVRRGLVLCGKLLTSLCNDNEFGHKDLNLMEFNGFLVPYRQSMKGFLEMCSAEDNSWESTNKVEANVSTRLKTMKTGKSTQYGSSPTICNPTKQSSVKAHHGRTASQPLDGIPPQIENEPRFKSLNSKVKGQSLSAENLRTKTLPTYPQIEPEISSLLLSISKNLERFDKDIQDRKKTLTNDKSELLVSKFNHFKDLLDHSPYICESEPGTFKKKSSWWFKIWGAFKI